MKKVILSLLAAGSIAGIAAPSANADVVIVHHHRHHHHVLVVHPRMILVPGHWEGHWWRRHWVPAHYVPA